MNIAIDIDGVLLEDIVPFIEFLKSEGSPYKFKREEFVSRRFWEIFGCTKEESKEITIRYIKSDFFRDMKMIPDADAAVAELRKYFDLYVVTNRQNFTKKDTIASLNKFFGDSFKDVIFSEELQPGSGRENPKKKVIEEQLGCKYCIEDNMDVIKQLDAEKVKLIMFAQPWNSEVEGAVRLAEWGEIRHYIVGGQQI